MLIRVAMIQTVAFCALVMLSTPTSAQVNFGDITKKVGDLGGSLGDLGSNLGSQLLGMAGMAGQCAVKVNNQKDEFNNCKKEVEENWKAETDAKKQGCCKALNFQRCALDIGKKHCSDQEFDAFKGAAQKLDSSCQMYVETPALCGTAAVVPLISFVVISILTAIRSS